MPYSPSLQTCCPFFISIAGLVESPLSGSGKRRLGLFGRNVTATSGSLPRISWIKDLLHRFIQPFRPLLLTPFFSEVYKSTPHQFHSPSWLPHDPPPVPDCSMDMTPISEVELVRVIKKSKPSSAPSPLDRISYLNAPLCVLPFWTSSTGSSWRVGFHHRGRWQSSS